MAVIISSDSTSTIDAAATDNYFLKEGVVIAVVGYGQIGINGGSGAGSFVQLDGTIHSTSYSVILGSINNEGGGFELRLGKSAQLTSTSGTTVAMCGGNNFMVNEGTIRAMVGTAVSFSLGDVNTFYNSGRIIGDVGFFNASNTFVMDAGSIDGDVTSTDTGSTDIFEITGGTIRGTVDLGGGNDTLILRGGTVRDGDSGGYITGGEGDDTYKIGAKVGTLTESNGGGTDTVRASISFTLGAFFEYLALTGDDDLSGYGNGLANIITGNAGDNVLKGRGGADTLRGGAGADILDGGADTDLVSYAASSSGVTVSLATGLGKGGDADGDRLIGIENLTGSDSADILTGSKDANVLSGLGGDDQLRGGKGDDIFMFASTGGRDTVLDFQQGKDLLQLSGWGSVDTVFADLKPLMHQQGKDVIIDLDSLVAGDAIVLKNTLLKEMSAADFFVI